MKRIIISILTLFCFLSFNVYMFIKYDRLVIIYTIIGFMSLIFDLIWIMKSKYKILLYSSAFLAIISSFLEIPNIILLIKLFNDVMPIIFVLLINVFIIAKLLYFIKSHNKQK